MTLIRKISFFAGLASLFCFAQENEAEDPSVVQDSAVVQEATATPDSAVTDAGTDESVATADTANVTDTTAIAAEDSTAAEPEKKVKPRNKITYAEYLAKNKSKYKRRSRTLHHGLTLSINNFHDKEYGHMDEDADWGTGFGMYYFYRRYFGHYLGVQGRIGGLYRYSRWNFDAKTTTEELESGETIKLTHNIDRKFHNFAMDLPLTGKLGYHIRGTTGFIFVSATLGLTKPIYEMVDTENRLYLSSSDKELKNNLQLIDAENANPFPLYESHQTNKVFYMDDWEFNSWIGLGVESRLVSFEFQVFAIGGASQNENHRYYHIGHDSNMTWRLLLDFSLR